MSGSAVAKTAWTEEEIVRHYREAKDQVQIIPILADLNATTTRNIRRILIEAGIVPAVKIPKRIEDDSRGIFERRCSVSLERDGKRYSMKQVAKLHHRGYSFVQRRCFGDVAECVIDGAEYKVIHRRSG